MPDWKPDSYPSVSPYLISGEAVALVAFLVEVFDGELLRRFDHEDGRLMHAEVRIDDGVVMIGGAATSTRSVEVHVHLYVPDPESVHARALAAGAESVQPVARKDAHDDLRGGFRDPHGTATWWVSRQ